MVADTVLLHTRLAIIDLADKAWQPMSTADGRFHIVYNGEIYNCLELRSELEMLGQRFRSRSDTEVLLKAYIEWGREALTHLVGMFAFAILDTHRRTLFLARDFFGIKRLYSSTAADHFAFASEIKALLTVSWVSRATDPERLNVYLRYGITDHGGATLFADIRQLPSGHVLELSLDRLGEVHPVRYWDVDMVQRSDMSFEQAADRLRELLLRNVELHLRSDVPTGAAFSGGIDSSAIVMAMRQLEGPNLELHAFSYIADEPSQSEEYWVDIIRDSANTVTHKTRPKASDLVAELDALIAVQDEPFGSTSIYAQHCVFRLAQEADIKVVLDGQGADERLAGYRSYLTVRLVSLLRQRQWVDARRLLRQARLTTDRHGQRCALHALAYRLRPLWSGIFRGSAPAVPTGEAGGRYIVPGQRVRCRSNRRAPPSVGAETASQSICLGCGMDRGRGRLIRASRAKALRNER